MKDKNGLLAKLLLFGLSGIIVISLIGKFIEVITYEEPKKPENAKTVTVNKEEKPTIYNDEEIGTETDTSSTTAKTEVTKEEFEAKYQLDPEDAQYPNGKFELKDGTIVNADYMSYRESDLFAYALVTFYEGKLAEIQMETEASEEEIKAALGLTEFSDETLVEPFDFGYEITFNQIFHESNIMWYPNEWD